MPVMENGKFRPAMPITSLMSDEELDRLAVITVADIADAEADLKRRRPEIARKIGLDSGRNHRTG